MKKWNRILSVLLVLCMMLTMAPMPAAAVVAGQDEVPGEQTGIITELNEQTETASAIVDGETGYSAVEIENPGVDLKQSQIQIQENTLNIENEELVRVIVELEEDSLLEQGFTQDQIVANNYAVSSVAEELIAKQMEIAEQIFQMVEQSGYASFFSTEEAEEFLAEVKYHYTVALNGMAMEIPYGSLAEVREMDGVKNAYVATQYELPEDSVLSGETSAEPNMYATNQTFGSAQTWTELGYTGKGMVVAVIDTGLDLDHPSFAAAPEGASMTLADVESVLTELNAYNLYGETSAVKLTADRLYRSEKVPYAFNYVDAGLDVTHDYDGQGDHGTHVAGIVAANHLDTTSVVGVAPDAQLVIMKVFGQNGGAYSDDILAAIEDCVRLDVDVVNMSLGSPAGFTEDSELVNEVFGRVLECDMVLAVAAGNSGSAAQMNTLGTNLNLTSDPDIGMVTSPSTYLGSTMVASMENEAMMMPYFTVGENKAAYVDVTYFNFANLSETNGGVYEYVMVPGLGEASDYEGLDVAGKVAVVMRGTIDFTTKQANAYNAGAVALVVYDNVEGDLVSMYDGGYLPNVFISKADGAMMAEAAGEDGVGELTIMPYGVETAVPNSVAGQLSDFSSWGVTPDLILAPDVTAPGGNIYSTLTDGAYGTMSGTSMASPHIAGMSALVLQYLHEEHGDLTEEQMHVAAESLVMNTAVPVVDPDGILYSPRKQGAGSANVYSAVVSPVYMTVEQTNGESTPKASLGDDDAKTGEYTFSFVMHNFSDEEQSYYLDSFVLTDQYVEIGGEEYFGETGRNLDAETEFSVLNVEAMSLEYDANQDGRTDMDDVQFLLDVVNGLETLDEDLAEQMDLNGNGILNTVDVQLLYELLLGGYEARELVSVAAGETLEVTVTITLTAEDKAYMDEHYANGTYVEGFIRAFAQSEGAVDLSLPFVGFYGDWSAARIFDNGWYYDAEVNDEDTSNDYYYNRYMNVIFADLGSSSGGLGLNPYLANDPYSPEHNVLSPNGDTYYDYVPEMYLSQLRNAELIDFTWTNDETEEELFYEWYAYARKSYYWAVYGICLPTIYTDGGCAPFTFYDADGDLMVEDLDHLTLTIRGYLDDGDLDALKVDENGNPDPDTAWADDVIEVPVVIDTTAPKLDVSSIRYTTDADGRNYVSFDVEDNYDIAAVVAMTVGGGAYEYIPVNTKVEGVDGEKATITIDITDFDATFQIALCDYGCNESFYELTNTASTGLSGDRFYAFRRYSTIETSSTVYATDQLNGWYSFQSADSMMMHTSQASSGEATVYAAEYVDGYIFGAQAGTSDFNTLFVMKSGSWDRVQLGAENAMNMYAYEWPGRDGTYFPLKMIALDMAYDYTSGTMYILANALENSYFPEGEINILLSMDITTGAVTVLGKIEPGNDEFLALTLACDNEGVLYTVNYEDGKLYTINKTPVATTTKDSYGSYEAECVNPDTETKYWPAAYTQSMTVDHATDTLYWAGYQGKVGTACFIELDKQTGDVVTMTYTQHNGEMAGLFKPWSSGKDEVPDAELESISMSDSALYMNVGQNATLTVKPSPYNAPVGELEWYSEDESVATVSPYGIVEAVGVGSTNVYATCGDGFEAVCSVNVSDVDGTLFAFSGDNWLLMDAGKPFEANQIVDTIELGEDETITAAAYLHGYVYAAAAEEDYDEDYNTVYTTNLYKLDANTLTGEKVGSYEGKTTALAFNYADGFMYGLIYSESYDEDWNATISYNLVRVNVNTAETAVVTNLDSIYPYSNLTGGCLTCSGALAIDYEGNFYVNGDNNNLEYNLVRFNLGESGQIANVTEYEGFSEYGNNGDAMVWSERNGGLLHIGGNVLEWVDVSDMENVVTISLGEVRGASYDVYALAIPLNSEPAVPAVTPTAITLEERYSVPAGETVKVVPTVEPWNASGSFTFEIADTSVATVDANGVITGILEEGETTITVTEVSSGLTASATVYVEKNPGYLYGYFQANMTEGIPLEAWTKVPISNAEGYEFLTDVYDFTIYAAAYYDGTLYAIGKHSDDGFFYTLKISPANFSYQVVGKADVLVRDMAFDYTTGTMYAVGSTEMIKGGLYQMDLDTMELTLMGDSGYTLVALACDDEGSLYAANDYGEVISLDKTNGWPYSTDICGSSSQYLQSMTYDYNNDTIYWAVDGGLYELDVENQELNGLGGFACTVSGLFSVPEEEPVVPETVTPSGVAMDEKNTVAVGETLTLDAVVLPISVSTVDQTLTWSSDNESIATVDENGVVTGVSEGTANIYAADSKGNASWTEVVVTAEHRYFYGYDELSRSWVSFDTDGVIVNTWADAEELSPIVAAQYIGDTLYAYDADGYFYTVDTETFERTRLGDGIYGETTSLEAWDETHDEQVYYVDDIPYQMVDMAYSQVVGRGGTVTTMYGVMMAYNISTWRDSFSYQIVELDMETGEISAVIVADALVDGEMSLRPTNLIYRNEYLYTVNGYITGMITRIDPAFGDVNGTYIFPDYWGDFNGGRSMIEDTLTGEVYAIRDMRTEYIGTEGYTGAYSTSVLCTINLGVALCEQVSTVGSNMRITGLFIK